MTGEPDIVTSLFPHAPRAAFPEELLDALRAAAGSDPRIKAGVSWPLWAVAGGLAGVVGGAGVVIGVRRHQRRRSAA